MVLQPVPQRAEQELWVTACLKRGADLPPTAREVPQAAVHGNGLCQRSHVPDNSLIAVTYSSLSSGCFLMVGLFLPILGGEDKRQDCNSPVHPIPHYKDEQAPSSTHPLVSSD